MRKFQLRFLPSIMNRILTLPVSVLLAFFSFCSHSTSVDGDNYKMVWQDEFDGTQIDRSSWGFQTGGGGWGNNELEYYTDRPENASVSDGHLVITARKENYNGREY